MHYVGALIGGLIATGVLTFLLSWLLRWVVKAPVGRLIAANALSLAIATSVAAFSLADGGPPQFAGAFLLYLLPQIVWLIVGFVIMKGRAKAAKPT